MNDFSKINKKWNTWTSSNLLLERDPGTQMPRDQIFLIFVEALDSAQSLSSDQSRFAEAMAAVEVARESGISEEAIRRACNQRGIKYDELSSRGYRDAAVAGLALNSGSIFIDLMKQKDFFGNFKKRATKIKHDLIVERFPHTSSDKKLTKLLQVLLPSVQAISAQPGPMRPGKVDPAMVLALMECKGHFGEEYQRMNTKVAWGLRGGAEDWREVTDPKEIRKRVRKFVELVRNYHWRFDAKQVNPLKKHAATHGPLNRDPNNLATGKFKNDEFYSVPIDSEVMTAGVVLGFICAKNISKNEECTKSSHQLNFSEMAKFYKQHWKPRWIHADKLLGASGVPSMLGDLGQSARSGLGNTVQNLLMLAGVDGATAHLITKDWLFLNPDAEVPIEAQQFLKQCEEKGLDRRQCLLNYHKWKGPFSRAPVKPSPSVGGIPIPAAATPTTQSCPKYINKDLGHLETIMVNRNWGSNAHIPAKDYVPYGVSKVKETDAMPPQSNILIKIFQSIDKDGKKQCFEFDFDTKGIILTEHRVASMNIGSLVNGRPAWFPGLKGDLSSKYDVETRKKSTEKMQQSLGEIEAGKKTMLKDDKEVALHKFKIQAKSAPAEANATIEKILGTVLSSTAAAQAGTATAQGVQKITDWWKSTFQTSEFFGVSWEGQSKFYYYASKPTDKDGATIITYVGIKRTT